MKRTKVIKSWSKHNLPADIWPEILSRLPVKSLLRFRCVSKSWKTLIDDQSFCRLHLNNFKNNRDETRLFVAQYAAGTYKYVVRCGNTFKTTARLDYLDTVDGSSQTFTTSPLVCWNVEPVCSADGLVMLKHYTRETELILWNPSIRRARTLPPSPAISEGMCNVDLGFEYNPFIKGYKHVRFVQCGENNLHSISVYTFGTCSWKTIKFQGKGICSWRWFFPGSYGWRTVCLRGAIYFIPSEWNSTPRELVSFDLCSEVFASTSLPLDDDLKPKGSLQVRPMDVALTLVDGGCSLGVVYYLLGQGSIWILESSEGDISSNCWTKHYKFASVIPDSNPCPWAFLSFIYLKKNGNMILKYRKQVSSYNLESHEEKTLLTNGRGVVMNMVYGYTESLLLLNGDLIV